MFKFNRFYIAYVRYFTDVVKKCLEKHQLYSLIVSEKQKVLLKEFVELLSTFEVLTKYAQSEYYPTLNTMLLFRSDIIEK